MPFSRWRCRSRFPYAPSIRSSGPRSSAQGAKDLRDNLEPFDNSIPLAFDMSLIAVKWAFEFSRFRG